MTDRTPDEIAAEILADTPYRQQRMVTPMPPSLRDRYRGKSKQPPSARKGKGIAPWHRRRAANDT